MTACKTITPECAHKDRCGSRCDVRREVRVVVADTKYDCDHLEGTFLDDSHYDLLVDEDCDFYAPPSGIDGKCSEANIIFKLRKNVFSADEMRTCYEALSDAATGTQNRGAAGGFEKTGMLATREWVNDFQHEALEAMLKQGRTIDGRDFLEEVMDRREELEKKNTSARVWGRAAVLADHPQYEGWFDRWLEGVKDLPSEERKAAAEKACGYMSNTHYANEVMSGIAGYFDRYPRIPYGRATSYTEHNPERFKGCFQYVERLNEEFKYLLPERWARQRAAADKLDPRFLVGNTVFTTITVNKNFRTAAHWDAGDLSTGFSNLGVITNGKDYRGGYLVLPEFRVAVNIRPGDVLLINNHEGLHGNTAIEGDEGFERMSLVCYFREKMLDLGSWEYEQVRKLFVETRRQDRSHPEWRHLWNGVSPGMWDTQEWYDFLTKNLSEEEARKYHPEAFQKAATLEDLFG